MAGDELLRLLPPAVRASLPKTVSSAEGVRVLRLRRLDAAAVEGLPSVGHVLRHIEELDLRSCTVRRVRELGACWGALTVLHLGSARVETLDGIGALRSLREVYAPFNRIADITPLGGLAQLEVLDLEGNDLRSFQDIQCLQEAITLRHLTLEANPVSHSLQYRGGVALLLQGLLTLDDKSCEVDRMMCDPVPFLDEPTLPEAPLLDVVPLQQLLDDAAAGSSCFALAVGAEGLEAVLEVCGTDPEARLVACRARTAAWPSERGSAGPVQGAVDGERQQHSGLTTHTQQLLCGKPTHRLRRMKKERYDPPAAIYPYPFARRSADAEGKFAAAAAIPCAVPKACW